VSGFAITDADGAVARALDHARAAARLDQQPGTAMKREP
jgi:hypothetical protein